MARIVYERISQREYAKRLGVSNTHVSNAVNDKLIKRGWDAQAKMIIVQLADKEWGDSVRRIPKQQEITTLNNPLKNNSAGPAKLSISPNADYAEAKRVGEIAKAQMALVELSERTGKLVDKVTVQKALYEYGMEIKKSFEQIPQRNVDLIRAAPSRVDALNIFEDAIKKVLTRLTEVSTTGLDKKI